MEATVSDTVEMIGVDTSNRTMAVSQSGVIVFKQSQRSFVAIDAHHGRHQLTFPEQYGRYERLQIIEFLFISDLSLAICLQDNSDGEYFICQADIDLDNDTMTIGQIVATNIRTMPGRKVILTRDEKGVILLSHQISSKTADFVQLFHVSNYLKANAGSAITIQLKPLKVVQDDVFTNVLIANNVLYLFFSIHNEKCMIVPLSGLHCGRCELRVTRGFPPPDHFMTKTLEMFDTFALVYANQSSRKSAPQLYLLDLMYLRWRPIGLLLTSHLPDGNISFRSSGNADQRAYLHGNCHVAACTYKMHLYQLDISHLGSLCRSRTSSASSLFVFPSDTEIPPADQRRRYTQLGGDTVDSKSCASLPLSTPPRDHPDPPVITRFKKNNRTERAIRSASVGMLTDEMSRTSCARDSDSYGTDSSIMTLAGDPEEGSSRIPRPPSLHWAEEETMEGVDTLLTEQIKMAKEMGYSDEVIHEALNINGKDGELYMRFGDINQMLDLMNKLASPEKRKLRLSVYDESSRHSRETPRGSSMSRSSSFHVDSRKMMRDMRTNTDIKRLMDTLEKEHERNKKNMMEQIDLLMHKIDALKVEKQEMKKQIDDEILAKLHLDKQLKDQRELEEYRRSQLTERIDQLRQELDETREERNQMRDDMQQHIRELTELQAKVEEKDRLLESLDMEGLRSPRISGFRPHCTICLERWPNILFLKCMHLAVCDECHVASSRSSNPLVSCPNCRDTITGYIKVYN